MRRPTDGVSLCGQQKTRCKSFSTSTLSFSPYFSSCLEAITRLVTVEAANSSSSYTKIYNKLQIKKFIISGERECPIRQT